VAANLQRALEEELIAQEHAQHLVGLATSGIKVEEWRDLEGKALDLSAGNTKVPEDEDMLLKFYFDQACHGRCILLSEARAQELDQLGELVLSPSFLVRAEGKKPRAILHLSSTDRGVNQRLVDELEAHEDGYSTIKSISTEIVKTFVNMVLAPGKYHFDDICGTELSLIVMDADSAFTRCPTHEDIVGKDRMPMEVTCVADVLLVHEMEVIFFTDKTHKERNGVVRSFFAIPDLTDERCVVRDMATFWLQSEQVQEYDVFSWDNNEAGVTRSKVNKVLKASTVAVGIAGADVASHSCRITGLSRLLAQGMEYHCAREHGRWSRNSTCVLKYFWPHTTMARDFACSIWEGSAYSRVRGGGAISYL
jgi:hypothetical protein